MRFRWTGVVLGLGLTGAVGIASAALVQYDLSTGATVVVNGATFITPPSPPINSGTGLWDPFVRIQTSGNNADSTTGGCGSGSQQTCEQGYNTSDRAVQFDEKGDQNYTRDLKLNEVPIITLNGVKYLKFLLDIAEPAAENANQSKNLLSLDQLQLFVGADQATNTPAGQYTPTTGNGTLGTLLPLYSLDLSGGDDNYLTLDYNLVGSGNGRADMIALIPQSVVPANLLLDGNNSVYLFSRFGEQVGPLEMIAEGSFEEWAVIAASVTCPPGSTDPNCGGPTPSEIPEPATLALASLALLGAASARRRKQIAETAYR